MAKPKLCINCDGWKLLEKTGQCRRHSPTRNLSNKACWPITLHTDWCCDHNYCSQSETDSRKEAILGKPVIKSTELDDIEIE